MIAVAGRQAELLADRTLRVQPLLMSGVTPKNLWVMWYEQAETVVVKVLDQHNCWWVQKDDVLLVPPHSVEPLQLIDGTLYICHEANAIARIGGTGR
jgi:hypothetical protein